MARTVRHRWWRPTVGTLTLVAAWVLTAVLLTLGFVAAALAAGAEFAMGGGPARLFANPVVNIAALLLPIVMAVPAAFLAVWGVQRRPIGSLSSVTGRLRWRWLATCLGLALLAVVAGTAALYVVSLLFGTGAVQFGPGWVGWSRFLVAAAVLLALVPVQSAAEEYVFRGWIVQAVGAHLRNPWFGIGLASVLFALAHGYGTPWGLADLMLYGVVAGWLVVRTGGLESAVALHVANNVVGFLLSAAAGSLGTVRTAAQASWQLLAIDTVVLPAYAWLIVRLARRRHIANSVPAGIADEPASGPAHIPP